MKDYGRIIARFAGFLASRGRDLLMATKTMCQSEPSPAAKKRECTDLHRRLDAATTAIAALHHDNTLLRQELAHHRADVLPIRPTADQ